MPQVQLPALVILVLCLGLGYAYTVPKATVKVNQPKGFEVSIPDEPGITLFAFHGKVNGEMENLSDQTWAVDVVNSKDGRWIYRNHQQKLQPGDVLYYWTTVRYEGLDYHNYNQLYRVGQDDVDQVQIDLRSNAGVKQPINIYGNPTINIFVQ